MKYVKGGGDSSRGEWRRIDYPAILKRIRAMYNVGDGRSWGDASHPKTLEMLKKHKEEGMFDLNNKLDYKKLVNDYNKRLADGGLEDIPLEFRACAVCFSLWKKECNCPGNPPSNK